MAAEINGHLDIFLKNRTALVDYAARLTGSRDQAEDIVQDAFLRLKPDETGQYSPGQTVSYFYNIVRNLAFDAAKRRNVETRGRDTDPPFWILPQDPGTPEQTVLLADQARVAAETLDGLPPDMRRAIELYRIEGLTLEAIAADLQISIATAHRLIRNGMVKIALSLDRASH
jgi:RNA polymerase sigma factor (sigma-70 family)